MSRRHAQISYRNGRGHFEDLGSSNGTFLRLRGPARAGLGGPHPIGRRASTVRDRIGATSPDDRSSPPPDISIEVFGKTDVGLVREHNEDNFLIADVTGATRTAEPREPFKFPLGGKGAALLVCDGMGGAAAGEVASQMAVDSIYDALAASEPQHARRLRAPAAPGGAARQRTHLHPVARQPERTRHGHDLHGRRRWCDDTLVVAQIGDSRCYILRDGKLAQVTKDQSLAWQLIEAGAMTADEAKAFEHANIILQALGVQERVEVVLSQVSLRKGDIALLCSDGLHGPVSDEEILAILIGEPNLQKAGEALIQKALDRDGPDNITVVLGRFDGAGLMPPDRRRRRLVRRLRPGRRPGPRAAGRRRRSAAWRAKPSRSGCRATCSPPTTSRPRRSRTIPTPGRPEAKPRSGRSLLALFLLALVAAATGGIFVMKCEHDPASKSPYLDVESPMAPCPHCSNEIDDGARFCGVCGRPITPTADKPWRRAARGGRAGRPRPRPAPPTPRVVRAAAAVRGADPFRLAPRRLRRPRPRRAAAAAPAAVPPARGRAPRRRQPGAGRPARRGGRPIRGPTQPLENLIGRTLNHRYLVEDKIGEGGFGAVFRGKQIATGREVALKILHPHNVSDETIVARFRREAEACSKLRDPHTVTTYDFDETPDGILYLAMELLRGRSAAPAAEGRGAAGVGARVAHPGSGRGVAARGARQRHRPPRHEAGERLHRIARRRGSRQGARLRHRQGDVRRSAGARADRRRPDAGHAGVHVAGAAARAEAGRALGHLRARHDGVRDADREAAVPEREDADRHHQLPHEARGAAAVAAGIGSRSRRRWTRSSSRWCRRTASTASPTPTPCARRSPARSAHSTAPRPLRALPPGRRHRRRPIVVAGAADPASCSR